MAAERVLRLFDPPPDRGVKVCLDRVEPGTASGGDAGNSVFVVLSWEAEGGRRRKVVCVAGTGDCLAQGAWEDQSAM
ncbi:MAG: hypothetical protein CMJ83_07385 [Planctomycetes bacterium]|nr:hypothetical protein [Planctomycetota bacterium]